VVLEMAARHRPDKSASLAVSGAAYLYAGTVINSSALCAAWLSPSVTALSLA